MSGAIPPFPQYAFMPWCSVKAQGQLYFFFSIQLLRTCSGSKITDEKERLDWKDIQTNKSKLAGKK
jgi:hypothetical protein